jgi:hypothetical protein
VRQGNIHECAMGIRNQILNLEFFENGFSSWRDHSAQNFREPFVMRPVGPVRMTNEASPLPQFFW